MRFSPRCALALTLSLGLALPVGSAFAQALPLPDDVVARRGGVDLTFKDMDVKIRTMPPELRSGYLRESDRASRMIDSMLLTKQIAERARQLGIDKEPGFLEELELAATELLSRTLIERVGDEAALPNVEALAYERYVADPKAVTREPRIDISHILVPTDGLDEATARSLAEQALARARAGEDFGALAKEYGRDKNEVWSIQGADVSRLDPRFAAGVAQLDAPGDLVGPVRTQFGYHIIRLDLYHVFPTPPFEEVREKLVKELTAKARDKAKADFLATHSQQDVQLNDAAIQSLPTRYLPRPDDAAQQAPAAAGSAGKDASR